MGLDGVRLLCGDSIFGIRSPGVIVCFYCWLFVHIGGDVSSTV